MNFEDFRSNARIIQSHGTLEQFLTIVLVVYFGENFSMNDFQIPTDKDIYACGHLFYIACSLKYFSIIVAVGSSFVFSCNMKRQLI